MLTKLREKLSVSKQATHKFDIQRFDLSNLNNRFAALQNLDDDMDFSRAWENIKISVKENLGHYE